VLAAQWILEHQTDRKLIDNAGTRTK
jgi:hypothetical protein